MQTNNGRKPTNAFEKLNRHAAMLATGLMLTACTTMTDTNGPAVNTVACRAFEPITWSEDDTRETIVQIKAHNAAWKAVCEA